MQPIPLSLIKQQLSLSQLPKDLLAYYDLTNISDLNMAMADDIVISGAINSKQLEALALDCVHQADTNRIQAERLQIGIDEAGRGPLLGNVVVSAVLLPKHLSGHFDELTLAETQLALLNDSKKLTEKKREKLYQIIPNVAIGYVTVSISAKVIDTINILQASLLGMRLAGDYLIASVIKHLQLKNIQQYPSVDFLYDGNKLPIINGAFYNLLGMAINDVKHEAIVKGDGKYAAIAAASVLAKVTRDAQMYELAKKYPNYGIEKHKGYPTKAHFEMLATKGVLAEHRMSFAPVKNAHKLG